MHICLIICNKVRAEFDCFGIKLNVGFECECDDQSTTEKNLGFLRKREREDIYN